MSPSNIIEEQLSSPDLYCFSTPVSRCTSPYTDEDNGVESCSDHGSSSQAQKSMFMNFTPDLNPQNAARKQRSKKSNTYKVNGVNILNRKSLDSKTVMERLKRRRENHNHVERKRRDNINHTILEISRLIPQESSTSTKLNKGNILRMAVDYIKELQSENLSLKSQSRRYLSGNGTCLDRKTSIETNPSPYSGPTGLNIAHDTHTRSRCNISGVPKMEAKSYYSTPPFYTISTPKLATVNDQRSYTGYPYSVAPTSHQQPMQPSMFTSLPGIAQLSDQNLPPHSSSLDPPLCPSRTMPGSSKDALYYRMQHRGLMLTEYHNTINLI